VNCIVGLPSATGTVERLATTLKQQQERLEVQEHALKALVPDVRALKAASVFRQSNSLSGQDRLGFASATSGARYGVGGAKAVNALRAEKQAEIDELTARVERLEALLAHSTLSSEDSK
jgi:phage-related tail protein